MKKTNKKIYTHTHREETQTTKFVNKFIVIIRLSFILVEYKFSICWGTKGEQNERGCETNKS